MTFELNENQKMAVEYWNDKPLFIEAGPGSGKTRVISERVKFLVNEKNIDPESLLVITFTERAAEELRDRLSDYFPVAEINKMNISTIHSYCYDLLLDKYPEYRVISEEQQYLFLSNNKVELGFNGIFFLPNSEIKVLMDKYNEYATFNVNTEKLVNYIQSEKPFSRSYVDFVKSHDRFPRDEIKDSEFKEDWYNAKYLQIARSYPKYLELLDKNSYFDFNTLQIKALDYLNNHIDKKHQHILIDEFQDTDPIQAKIFERLMLSSMSFTAVGDNEQSIYGFRGSNEDYFDYFNRNYDIELISLNINYRSTKNLIELTEDFIKNQRKEYSNKSLKYIRNITKDNYYLQNSSKGDEAHNLLKVIKNLKEEGTVKNYSDIAILYRSVTSNSNSLSSLIELFKLNDIPFTIQGLTDLIDQDEIKSIITLFYFLIIDENDPSYVMSKWQKEWLNLKAFTGDNFETLWDLSEDTKDYLRNLQDNFEEIVLFSEKKVYLKVTGKKSRIKGFKGVFNRETEILKETFKDIDKPKIDLNMIKNPHDYHFFKELFDLKNKIGSSNEFSIFDIFYELLEITGYFSRELICSKNHQDELKYISFITTLIDIFENFSSKFNFKNFYWFMYHMIEEYSVEKEDSNGVKIMTIHKSKGLESPVVIVPSFQIGKFPRNIETLNPESGYKSGKPVYYTPNKYLKYKDYSMDAEIAANNLEELRIIYVAMTRAEDILILSSIGASPINDFIEKNNLKCLDDFKISDKCEKTNRTNDSSLSLSFTSFKLYQFCPCKYNLSYNLKFKTKPNLDVEIGTLIHNALNDINTFKINNNQEIDNKKILEIAKKTYNLSNIYLNDLEYEEYEKNIEHYYNTFGSLVDVVDSERPFKIKKDNYNLIGSADLIYKTRTGKYGILDYKNTEYDSKRLDSYKKQLYTYILALKEFNIEEAKIYAIKSRQLIDIPIDREYLNMQLKEIEEVVGNIEDKNYPPRISDYCLECEFSQICK